MTDVYVSHADGPTLETFAGNFTNHLTVQPGRAAVAASTDENGNPIPAVPAAGDPALFYTCVRAMFDITPLIQAPFAIVDAETGAIVVGEWA